MPAALSTTKRKFHKILDAISNASSTSLASGYDKYNASTTTLPASMDPPAKKLRVARPTSAYVAPTTRIMATSTSATRPLSVMQQPALGTLNEERKAPNFAPWDRGRFLERLKTYRHVDKWRSKPEGIGEVEWAKRGWSCVGKERIRCVGGCEREVVIALETGREEKENAGEKTAEEEENEEDEDEWREKAQRQLVEKYTEMIATAHDGGCLWRRRGCDDTIYRLPLAHQATAIGKLRERYISLASIASELPSNPSTPENLDLSEIYEHILPLLQQSTSNPATDAIPATLSEPSVAPPNPEAPQIVNKSALALALFGWQAEEGHISGLATCSACFRRLGLWLFKPCANTSSPSSMDRLDVVGEHRDYCPWINPLSQNGIASRRTSLDGLAGWQVLLRAVNASAMHRKHDSQKMPTTPQKDTNDTFCEVASMTDLATAKEDRAERDEKDKERWAKLTRLRQVFHVKRVKGRDGAGSKPGGAIA